MRVSFRSGALARGGLLPNHEAAPEPDAQQGGEPTSPALGVAIARP